METSACSNRDEGQARAGESCGEVRTILLASPRSVCAGVERAIEIVELTLAQRGAPIYVRKQIVHNRHVVAGLQERGAVFVDELDEVPDGATVVFSAHGVSPQVRREAARRGLAVIDATCPLVTKVHAHARRFAARGDAIVLIGQAGHDEVDGTLGEAPGQMTLVGSVADVARLEVKDPSRVSYLTQTTLAADEVSDVIHALRDRFPALDGPGADDICYASTNRQRAVARIAAQADVVLVVGSANSSNSRGLAELAQRLGTPAYLIDDPSDIEPGWLAGAAVIGLTAGASAPGHLVEEVIGYLRRQGPVRIEERQVAIETIRFTLPKELRAPVTSPDHVPPRSLGDHVSGQLAALCAAAGLGEHVGSAGLARWLLGPASARPLAAPACWPSEVSDDHSPAELSVEFSQGGVPAVRLLAEPLAGLPGNRANAQAALTVVRRVADRFGYPLGQFDAVRELFLPDGPQGSFALWLALLLRPGGKPTFKVYFNPAARGVGEAPRLVAEALARLGYGPSYSMIADHALQRAGDHFSFFSLDLGAKRPRVKVYVAHHDAEAASLEAEARMVVGDDARSVGDFCRLAGGASGPFTGRPLHAAYTLAGGDARPRGYTLHLPIRDYVTDDAAALARARTLMAARGLDPAMLNRAVSAMTGRPLDQGRGLIAYVSLRLGAIRPGLTVYLSCEAYQARPGAPSPGPVTVSSPA
jgi:4-hydroxy-3-methylbut-2-enyl diphosphate reductase